MSNHCSGSISKTLTSTQTHGVLLQYLDLLTSPEALEDDDPKKSKEEKVLPLLKILPPLAEMGEIYGISPSICMQIWRPKLNDALLVRHIVTNGSRLALTLILV
jgi:hypothetical protein